MSLNTVTLHWDLTDLIQSGLSATLSITPTAQLSDSTDHILIPPVARTYTFSGGSGQLAGIVANDNSAILPAGTGYLISVTAGNGVVIVPQFQTRLLFSNGADQWLDTLATVPVVTTSYQYLPLPSGTPTAGQVPVATGSGEASAWGSGGGGFNSPMTTLGDTLYENATPAAARLAGNTSAVKNFLTQTGTGSVSAPPAWGTLQTGDIPDQAWQFRPETYGAKGDGKAVTDAVMTSGSPNLACTTSTPFTSTGADGGKYILVSAAGGGTYTPKMFTISTVTDSGHAVLNANASSSTSGTPGAIAYFGTDDTAAIQSAINAAVTYAQAHNGYAEVLFGDKIYIIAGAFTVGGATLGNFQIQLPIIDATTGVQVVLSLRGARDTTPLMHWLQVTPQASGTILASVRTDGTNNGTYGPSSVIGGPINGYGGEPGTFSNALVKVRGISTLVPYNATMSGLDLFGMVEADVDTFSCMTAAVVPTSSAPVPSLSSPSNISNQYTFGLRMPDTGNQTVCRVGQFSSEGMCYGFCPSEWTYAEDIHIMYAIVAIAPWAGGVTMVHSALIVNAQCENCTNALGLNGTGTARIDILNLQTESISSSALVFDPSSQLQGTIGLRAQGSAGNYTSNGWLSGGGAGGALLRIINEMTTPGPVASPQSVPASGSAFLNGYTRDAYVIITGGSVTGISIDGTATGLTSGTLMVPSGHKLTLTYSAVPTWTWVLL